MDRLTSGHHSGHAFISYVREDAQRVDRLQAALEAAGVRVWRDIDDLWPGQDWRIEIRRAITNNSLAFVACFSENSESRNTSYQNEELILAVEQMRLRAPGRSWLIPVRFAECSIPTYDLGAGRTLDSIQCVDLFGGSRELGMARLIAAVLRILGSADPKPGNQDFSRASSSAVSIVSSVKSTLLAPEKQIEMEDLVADTTRLVCNKLKDQKRLPVRLSPKESLGLSRKESPGYVTRYIVDQARLYASSVEPITELLIPGVVWGRQEHNALWTRCIQAVANADTRASGKPVLIALKRFPVLYLFYAVGLGALHRRNFGALKAIAIDAKFRTPDGLVPIIGQANPWLIFKCATNVERSRCRRFIDAVLCR